MTRLGLLVYSAIMATKRIEHVFDCDVDTYWKEVFLDEGFNKQLFIERLGFSRWELTQTDTADGVRRVVHATPSAKDLPGPLQKVLQNGLGYREEGEWWRSQSLYRLRVIPASLADKVDVTGEMRVVAEGSDRCRRIYDARVEARVFMVGGLLEGRILADVVTSYDEAAVFSRQWLARAK